MSEPVIRLVMAPLGDAEGFCGLDGCATPDDPVGETAATSRLVGQATSDDAPSS